MQYNRQGQRVTENPGYLNTATYKAAKTLLKESLGTKVPFRLLDCWICGKKVEEKTESGIVLQLHDYSKDRETQLVVLGAGPGYRVSTGPINRLVENGEVVPNPVAVGDVVQVLERLLQKVELDGEEFWFVESHKVLFIIE